MFPRLSRLPRFPPSHARKQPLFAAHGAGAVAQYRPGMPDISRLPHRATPARRRRYGVFAEYGGCSPQPCPQRKPDSEHKKSKCCEGNSSPAPSPAARRGKARERLPSQSARKGAPDDKTAIPIVLPFCPVHCTIYGNFFQAFSQSITNFSVFFILLSPLFPARNGRVCDHTVLCFFSPFFQCFTVFHDGYGVLRTAAGRKTPCLPPPACARPLFRLSFSEVFPVIFGMPRFRSADVPLSPTRRRQNIPFVYNGAVLRGHGRAERGCDEAYGRTRTPRISVKSYVLRHHHHGFTASQTPRAPCNEAEIRDGDCTGIMWRYIP